MDGNNGDDLVRRAAAIGASSAHIAHDLTAAMFPKSRVLISDRMLSYAHQYLRASISAIETEVCLIATQHFGVAHEAVVAIGNSDQNHSFTALQTAGLFETRTVLDHVFGRAQRAELVARLLRHVSQEKLEAALTRYLDHDDAAIGEAAMGLLVAQSRSAASIANISDLRAETLHDLTWPVVAAIEKISGYSGPRLADAAQKLLGDHDESGSMTSRASRLAQLLDQADESSHQRLHPLEDGLYLFLAKLAQKSGLSAEQIVIFTAEPGLVRLIILLRALNLSSEDALSIFAALEAGGGILTAASYNEIDQEKARDLVRKWTMNPIYQTASMALSVQDRTHGDR